ncbi:MAG: DUF3467 domain-containing protein [Candidatus Buchananbacteria bacterium]|nr:DUF3467 domain-containing protein [Candidatus Buchananbacteria bacterium]
MTQTPEQKIQIRDTFAGAEYANAMQVGYSKEEFMLTFLNIAGPTGRVVGKIMTNPGHLKRLIKALEESLKKYEGSFGKVQEAESPKQEIGFRTE